MRTDVKVGLICVFAVVLGAVIYFVAQGNNHPREAKAGTPSAPLHAASSDPLPTPAPAAPATPAAPASTDLLGTQLAAAGTPSGGPGSSSLAGPSILPPSASGSTPAGNTTLAPATAPSLSGGSPIGAPGSSFSPAAPGSSFIPPASAPASGGFSPAPYSPGLAGGTPAVPHAPAPRGSIELGSPSSRTPGFGSSTPSSSFGTCSSFGTSSSFGSSSLATGKTHKIEKGDMLSTIAKKYGVKVKDIEAANPGLDPNRLKVGKDIKIPEPSTASTTTSTGGTLYGNPSPLLPGDHTTATTKPAKATSSKSAKTAAAPASTGAKITAKPGSSYTVKKGDTLTKIAIDVYGNKNAAARIRRANRGELPKGVTTLPVGTTLRLPV